MEGFAVKKVPAGRRAAPKNVAALSDLLDELQGHHEQCGPGRS
jgi:hypothetical protein